LPASGPGGSVSQLLPSGTTCAKRWPGSKQGWLLSSASASSRRRCRCTAVGERGRLVNGGAEPSSNGHCQQAAAALLLRPSLHQAGRQCWVRVPPSPTLSSGITTAAHRSHRHRRQPWRGLQRRWSAAQRKRRMPRTLLPVPSSTPRSSSDRRSSAGPRSSRRRHLPWRWGWTGCLAASGCLCVQQRSEHAACGRKGTPPPAAASVAPAGAAGRRAKHLTTHLGPVSIDPTGKVVHGITQFIAKQWTDLSMKMVGA
jgi:hypothetical protein